MSLKQGKKKKKTDWLFLRNTIDMYEHFPFFYLFTLMFVNF